MRHRHRDETVLVTGGSGFLGAWCLVQLQRCGFRLRTTLRDLSREREVRALLGRQEPDGHRLAVCQADLSGDRGWDEAVAGCDYVLHVASPFPPATPRDANELIRPARDGTLRVLRSALAAGVRRVVVMSSSAAAAYPSSAEPMPLTEDSWTDISHPLARPYVRSKTLAEQAAWTFMAEHAATARLTVVAPGTMLGPVLGRDLSYSVTLIQRILSGSMTGLPRLGFSFVDVRDVADLHMTAMTATQAAGERFLATGPFLWCADVARILREQLGAEAAKVPTRELPNLVVRAGALFDPSLRQLTAELGRRSAFSADKARTLLNWTPRPVEDTIADCTRSLTRHDLTG
jgi:dihydroflavonol-4-reductase